MISMLAMQAMSQEEYLKLSLKRGEAVEINVKDIKDISFVEDTKEPELEGEWFNKTESAYEVLTFCDDGTVDHFTYYFSYKMGLPPENGVYKVNNSVLGIYLPSLGINYYPVVRFTDSCMTLRINDKNYDYYKIEKTYNMQVGDDDLSLGGIDDVVVFVDNDIVGLKDNKIKALRAGTGYVLVENIKQNTIKAYKIKVDTKGNVSFDLSNYFGKSREEIETLFGDPNQKTYSMFIYEGGSFYRLSFDFYGNQVNGVTVMFDNDNDYLSFLKVISDKYVLVEGTASSTERVYGNRDTKESSSVLIWVYDSIMMINYGSF